MKLFNRIQGIKMSLPVPKVVHGVKIEKAPTGRYLQALDKIQGLPELILSECFPGKTLGEVMESLSTIRGDEIMPLVTRLAAVAPVHIIDALCEIIGVDRETALDRLTPRELLEVIEAFWEVNSLGDFFKNARRLTARAFARTTQSDG